MNTLSSVDAWSCNEVKIAHQGWGKQTSQHVGHFKLKKAKPKC